jgi:hypothetical protein
MECTECADVVHAENRLNGAKKAHDLIAMQQQDHRARDPHAARHDE